MIIKKVSSLFFLFLIIIGNSCDYVNNVKDPNAPIIKGTRNVLVEDYTGHKCGLCPPAAVKLRYIEKQYPGRVIPLEIHAGYQAACNAVYPTDLRSQAGNDYEKMFKISDQGNPNGLVNRKDYASGSTSFVLGYSVWEGAVVQMLSTSAKFEIKIKNSFSSSTNNLNTSITVKSLANNSGNYKLVVLLSEDSIIAEQLDYSKPVGSQLIPDYEFNHVLRGAINSSWGDAIFTGGAIVNDSIVKSYNNFTLKSLYKPSKCHVVAYVYDADPNSPTYYEVLQVEDKKVK